MQSRIDSQHADLLSARVGLVKKNRAVMLALAEPPPAPACWPNARDWRDWLMLTHASGVEITRRRDVGKYRGEREVTVVLRHDLDFCSACIAPYKTAMAREGRCFPSRAEKQRELEAGRPVEPETASNPAADQAGRFIHDDTAETA